MLSRYVFSTRNPGVRWPHTRWQYYSSLLVEMMVYILYCTSFWRRFQSCPKEPTADSANCICETDDDWDGADTVSCVELPNPRLGNMKGAWTHGAMMTHIRTFVCYFSRLKSLVLPAVGSTKPILRPRIQKPQAMVKHWWNRSGFTSIENKKRWW